MCSLLEHSSLLQEPQSLVRKNVDGLAGTKPSHQAFPHIISRSSQAGDIEGTLKWNRDCLYSVQHSRPVSILYLEGLSHLQEQIQIQQLWPKVGYLDHFHSSSFVTSQAFDIQSMRLLLDERWVYCHEGMLTGQWQLHINVCSVEYPVSASGMTQHLECFENLSRLQERTVI